MRRSPSSLSPFVPRGRRTIIAIVLTFVLVATGSAALSIWAISRSKNRATVLEIAARQRTLAERYVEELLLARGGNTADPKGIGTLLVQSAGALLDGGTAPAVNGDDDATKLPATTDPVVRAQLHQEQRLAHDLTSVGSAYLAGRPVTTVTLTAHERLTTTSARERIRILAALTSNVALNTARTIASQTDHNTVNAVMLQIGLGSGGILVSLLLAWALVAATRRQSAHYRSLVTSSTDLVLVLDERGCRYASPSVVAALGRAERDLLNGGFRRVVHEDDWAGVAGLQASGAAKRLTFRVRNAADEWRYLDANVTDLRGDRHLRGIVLNARDITDRVRLEQELTRQAQRDTFAAQLVEAFEMADEEAAAHEVVERAMVEIAADAPMELLLSDSSRAHLERAAAHPNLGAPGCPVESPFACVAVRRGNPVVFESSEALNACPKLRDRPGGACSAVCLPISFMGRSLGVLHATGPAGAPPRPDQVARLTTLAGQAGTRIGTVRAFEKTQLQASTDGLTGLMNRRTLENQLRLLMRQKTPFALAVADLDNFKQLNDAHGHEAGDRSLRTFAQTIRRTLRDVDLLGRWGGEEFVMVMPGCDAGQAVTILERVRANLSDDHQGRPIFTASFGITDSTMGETMEQLLTLADYALYASKNSGRDRVTIADPRLAPRHGDAGNGNGGRGAAASLAALEFTTDG